MFKLKTDRDIYRPGRRPIRELPGAALPPKERAAAHRAYYRLLKKRATP